MDLDQTALQEQYDLDQPVCLYTEISHRHKHLHAADDFNRAGEGLKEHVHNIGFMFYSLRLFLNDDSSVLCIHMETLILKHLHVG